MRGHEVASGGTGEMNHLGTPETLRYNRVLRSYRFAELDPKEVTQRPPLVWVWPAYPAGGGVPVEVRSRRSSINSRPRQTMSRSAPLACFQSHSSHSFRDK